jgi:hypothetical protein
MSEISLTPVWFAAEFTFATTYSIRQPGTSLTFAKACPVPGPGTVKLALIKTAVEFYGEIRTRQELFPVIRDMQVLIRPPLPLGVSGHFLRAFKNKYLNNGEVEYSLSYREHVHPMGHFIIYYECSSEYQKSIEVIFRAVGYWGQGNSLAYCISITKLQPKLGECIVRLDAIMPTVTN